MLDRKRGRHSRPHGAPARREARSRGARVLLTGLLGALAVALGLMGAMGAFASGGAPTAETERAEEITRTEAVLPAKVFPHSTETECEFQYGTVEHVLDKKVGCPFKPGHRAIGVPEAITLTGLAQSTTYYYRIHATNEHGEGNGDERSFTTLPTSPHANTEAAKEVKRTTATLTGYVTSDGSEVTECYFEWGTEKEGPLTERTSCLQTEFDGGSEPSEKVFVSAHLSGLAEGQLYYYRLVAKNAFGQDLGGKEHFQALPAVPKANTEPAKFVERTSAVLKGYVTPNDAKVTECHFQYGVSPELNKTAPCESFGAGSGEVKEAVSAEVTGLQEHTKYSFRLVAANSVGTGEGATEGFHTLPTGPQVEMHHANNVTATSAELSASVKPEEAPTECYFEYGTTPALGSVAQCENSPGEGEEWVRVGAKVSGLTPDTMYYVRIEAFNEFGSDRGGEGNKHNFTTAPGGQAPEVMKVKPKNGPSQGGNSVTIYGEHFEEVSTVYFGATEAEEITEVNAGNATNLGRIVAVAPPGVGKVDITVVTKDGTSAISNGDVYSYKKPTISSLTPDEGPASGGTEVTVTGSGFELGAHGTEFRFKKAKATSVECTSSTTCVVIVPPSKANKKGERQTGTVSVQAIVNHSGKSNRSPFTYTA